MRAEILQFSGLAPEAVQAAAFYEKSLHGDEAMERLCNVLRAAQSTEQRLAALGIEKDVVADITPILFYISGLTMRTKHSFMFW